MDLHATLPFSAYLRTGAAPDRVSYYCLIGGFTRMKVCVDNEVCQGHGRCNAVAPTVFQLDDSGYVALNGEVEVPPELEQEARRGVAACPESALSVIEG